MVRSVSEERNLGRWSVPRLVAGLDDGSGKFESVGSDLKEVAAPDGAALPFLLKGAAGDKECDCD